MFAKGVPPFPLLSFPPPVVPIAIQQQQQQQGITEPTTPFSIGTVSNNSTTTTTTRSAIPRRPRASRSTLNQAAPAQQPTTQSPTFSASTQQPQQTTNLTNDCISFGNMLTAMQDALKQHAENVRTAGDMFTSLQLEAQRMKQEKDQINQDIEKALRIIQERDRQLEEARRENSALKEELKKEKSKPPIVDEKLQNLSKLKSGTLSMEELNGLEASLRDWIEAIREVKEKKISELTDQTKCKICFEKEADALFLKCSHCCCCMACASKLNACPVCRLSFNQSDIARVIKS